MDACTFWHIGCLRLLCGFNERIKMRIHLPNRFIGNVSAKHRFGGLRVGVKRALGAGQIVASCEMHHLVRWQKLVVDAELIEAARLVFAPYARCNYAVAYGSARFKVAYECLQPAGFSDLDIARKNVKHGGLSVGEIAL